MNTQTSMTFPHKKWYPFLENDPRLLLFGSRCIFSTEPCTHAISPDCPRGRRNMQTRSIATTNRAFGEEGVQPERSLPRAREGARAWRGCFPAHNRHAPRASAGRAWEIGSAHHRSAPCLPSAKISGAPVHAGPRKGRRWPAHRQKHAAGVKEQSGQRCVLRSSEIKKKEKESVT